MQTHTAKEHLQQGIVFGARMGQSRDHNLNKFRISLCTVINKHSPRLRQKQHCAGVECGCSEEH